MKKKISIESLSAELYKVHLGLTSGIYAVARDLHKAIELGRKPEISHDDFSRCFEELVEQENPILATQLLAVKSKIICCA